MEMFRLLNLIGRLCNKSDVELTCSNNFSESKMF